MSSPYELALTESKTLRAQYRDRTDALDKVGALIVLPDGVHATVEMVANYYEVAPNTIAQIVKRHRVELESNGLHALRDAALRDFKVRYRAYLTSQIMQAPQLTVFTRQAILNVGQLLTESSVAEKVRRYLLAVEATATAEHRQSAVQLVRLQERLDYQNILHSLKLGGAVSEEYRLVQNTLYLSLYSKTAAQIRATQPQRTGEPLKRGEGFRKSTVAKDYLTEAQLERLDNTVLAVVAQLRAGYPNGATAAQMVTLINRAISLLQPHRIGA